MGEQNCLSVRSSEGHGRESAFLISCLLGGCAQHDSFLVRLLPCIVKIMEEEENIACCCVRLGNDFLALTSCVRFVSVPTQSLVLLSKESLELCKRAR